MNRLNKAVFSYPKRVKNNAKMTRTDLKAATLNLIEYVLDTIGHDKSGLIGDWGLDNISDLVYNNIRVRII